MLDKGVQIIYLTATFFLNDEAEFLDIMKVQIPNDFKFRGRTSCPKIVYLVVEYDVEETEAVCQLVAEKLEQYPALANLYSRNSVRDREERQGLDPANAGARGTMGRRRGSTWEFLSLTPRQRAK